MSLCDQVNIVTDGKVRPNVHCVVTLRIGVIHLQISIQNPDPYFLYTTPRSEAADSALAQNEVKPAVGIAAARGT